MEGGHRRGAPPQGAGPGGDEPRDRDLCRLRDVGDLPADFAGDPETPDARLGQGKTDRPPDHDGAARAPRLCEDCRCEGQGPAPRRNRDRRAGPPGAVADRKLLQGSGEDPGSLAGRLAPYGGRRLHRFRGVHPDHRPDQGRDQDGRRMGLVAGPGEPDQPASGGLRGGGDRRSGCQVGRAAALGHRAEAGVQGKGHGGGDQGLHDPECRSGEDPQIRHSGQVSVRGRDPQDLGREDQQDSAPETVYV